MFSWYHKVIFWNIYWIAGKFDCTKMKMVCGATCKSES